MRTCPYCGKEYPDTATVCELDANPLIAIQGANAAPPPTTKMNWLDKQFANSSGIFFWGLDARLLFGIIGVLACKHPTARKNAWIYLGLQIGIFALVFIIVVLVKNTR
jgi:peptidoglycan/LPS O-acetylase OafA/YrhL